MSLTMGHSDKNDAPELCAMGNRMSVKKVIFVGEWLRKFKLGS